MADPSDSGAARPRTADTLEQAVVALSARGDHRGVVRLVERWAASGEPNRDVLLAQCRSLVELRLMDRAWVRLNELIGDAPHDPEALLLAAEMFIERGWPARGRKLLDRVPEVHQAEALWQALSERADAPPLQPAANAREIEQSGSPAEQLELAERFQAAGSFLRARSILERLRRMDGPWTPRVDDLLWALSGEFAKEDGDPLTLAYVLVPSLSEPEEADYTESTIHDLNAPRLDDDDTGDDEEGGPAFPSLFRRLDEQPTETETASEVTSVSVMADKEAMRARLLADEDADEDDEFVEDLYDDGRSGDTQIMLIMRRGGGGEAAEAPDGPAHRRKEEEEEGHQLRETLNLRAYQQSMGMTPVGGREFSEEVALEEEDDDLIVVTRREKDPARALTDPPPEPAGPVQVIEKPILPDPPPPERPALSRPPASIPPPPPKIPELPPPQAEQASKAVAQRAPPPRRRPPPSVEDEEDTRMSTSALFLRLAIMAFVLMLVGLGLVLALSKVLQAGGG